MIQAALLSTIARGALQQVPETPPQIQPFLVISESSEEPIWLRPTLSSKEVEDVAQSRDLIHVKKDDVSYLFSKKVWESKGMRQIKEIFSQLLDVPEGSVGGFDSLSPAMSAELKQRVSASQFGRELADQIESGQLKFQLSYAVRIEVSSPSGTRTHTFLEGQTQKIENLHDKPIHVRPTANQPNSIENAQPSRLDDLQLRFSTSQNRYYGELVYEWINVASKIMAERKAEESESIRNLRTQLAVQLLAKSKMWEQLAGMDEIRLSDLNPELKRYLLGRDEGLTDDSKVRISSGEPMLIFQLESANNMRRFRSLGVGPLFGK